MAWMETVVLIVSMVIGGLLMYRALPKLGVRAMSESTIMKDAEELIDKKIVKVAKEVDATIGATTDFLVSAVDTRIESITSSLDAKVDAAVMAVDARVEKIFSEDVPKLLEEHVMTEENLTGFAELIRAGLHAELGQLNEGMAKVAESFKMAFIGNKGNEAKATKKDNLEAQKALAETAIMQHEHGPKILALAKQFDFDVPQMAAENPELAQMAIEAVSGFMNKQSGGSGGSSAGWTVVQ